MANAINWFEIPVTDMNRASEFYSKVLDTEIQHQELMGTKMGFLPFDDTSVSGALCEGEDYEPSKTGSLIYLNGGEDLGVPLARIEEAGGQIIMPKTSIGEHGFIAQFIDTEGNRVAFHSQQ